MANDNDWADPSELAGMSRGGNVLQGMGYDPEEVRANPALRAEVMGKLQSPYAQQSAASIPASQRAASLPSRVQQAAGMAPPAAPAQVSSQAAPATAAAPSSAQMAGGGKLDEIGAEALNRGLKLGGFAEQTARDMASSTGPDTAELEAERSKDALPTPYRDPQTGKVLDSAKQAGYKPGLGTEILRGLRGAVVGTLTGGIPGGIVGAIEPEDIKGGTGYGAPDRAYQATEASRQARLGSEDQQIENVRSNFKAMTDARGKAAAEARQGVTSYNDVAKGAAELENADTDAVKAQTDADTRKDNSPEGQTALSEAAWAELNKKADRLGLQGSTRTLYLANNGKIPDPRQPTAEEIARAQALKVFRIQNKRDPQTLDEINAVNATAAGRLKDSAGGEEAPETVTSAVADSVGKKSQYTANLKRLPNGDYLKAGGERHNPKDIVPAAEFNQTVDQYRLDLNKSIAKSGWQMDNQGNLVRSGQSAAAPAPAPVAAAPAAQAQVAPAVEPPPPPGATDKVYVAGKLVGHAVNGKFVPLGKK